MYELEILCASLEDCMIAQHGGATRIELNSAVELGGLTPSLGILKEAKNTCAIPIVTMVRPRPGDFIYDDDTYEAMKHDAKLLLNHGSDGLVFGFLNEDAMPDVRRTQEFVALAHSHGKEAIFHRAIDRTHSYEKSIEILISCGVDRILTSGQKETAVDGIDTLISMHGRFEGAIEFVCGSGITVETLPLFLETPLNQFHGSFKDTLAVHADSWYGGTQAVSLSNVREAHELLTTNK